jgi:biopolymer transport protein ExbB
VNLVEWLQRVMVRAGAEWVLWIMIALSVVSVAIILERAWFFSSLRDDLVRLARDLQAALDDSVEAAQRRMSASPSAEAAVVSAGLAMAHRGPDAAQEAMQGAAALQRMKLERRLAFLGTLGNNAPFIGLFGTVIGVVMAFDALGKQAAEQAATQAQNMAPTAVMASIGEALVATAVGIGIAIPAVVANNAFHRMTKSTLANTEALSRILLAHLKATDGGPFARRAFAAATPVDAAPPVAEPRSAGHPHPGVTSNKKKAAKQPEPRAEDDGEEKG